MTKTDATRTAAPAVTVRAGGFRTRLELLCFAVELERQPSIVDVAPVRLELDDAVFEVRVAMPADPFVRPFVRAPDPRRSS